MLQDELLEVVALERELLLVEADLGILQLQVLQLEIVGDLLVVALAVV